MKSAVLQRNVLCGGALTSLLLPSLPVFGVRRLVSYTTDSPRPWIAMLGLLEGQGQQGSFSPTGFSGSQCGLLLAQPSQELILR